jgi:hypothetical protein
MPSNRATPVIASLVLLVSGLALPGCAGYQFGQRSLYRPYSSSAVIVA